MRCETHGSSNPNMVRKSSPNTMPDDEPPPVEDVETEEPSSPPNPPPSQAEAPSEEPLPPVDDWSVRYKYLLAEFDNFRKRVEREREFVRREARGRVLRELIPLYESFDRALEAAAHLGASNPLRRGLDLIQKEWKAFLLNHGIEPVARIGEAFHADEEEAVGERVADAHHPDGTVAEVVQQGYRSAEGLLRPAKVLVARSPQESEPPSGGSVTSPP